MTKKLNENITAYYPCDICGHNSPSNVQFMNKNGQETSYCRIHIKQVKDWPESIRRAKNQQKFRDELKASFENPDY